MDKFNNLSSRMEELVNASRLNSLLQREKKMRRRKIPLFGFWLL